jgi:hypothetical protein
MFDLREKDLVNGRTYFDRMGNLLFLFLGPWLAVFSLTYIGYNNKVTGVAEGLIPMSWGAVIAGLLLGACAYLYFNFTKRIKTIPGKEFREKITLYYSFNKVFYIRLNLLGVISTLLYVLLNSGPLAIFNCFLLVVVSLEKPGEERFFRHLRLKKEHMKGFKDRSLFEE